MALYGQRLHDHIYTWSRPASHEKYALVTILIVLAGAPIQVLVFLGDVLTLPVQLLFWYLWKKQGKRARAVYWALKKYHTQEILLPDGKEITLADWRHKPLR